MYNTKNLPEWRNLPAGRQVVDANNMYTVYAIKSLSKKYIYVGLTNNLDRRIDEHQKGYNKTTKPYGPFMLLYTEEHSSRTDARKREVYLKSGIGKEFLKKII